MAFQEARGLERIVKAFGYSLKGFQACFRHEEAFRQEVYASLVLVPLALWLGESGTERALLLGTWLLVLIVELLNSAVEAAVDRISLDLHKLSERAKDIGSAAVFSAISRFAITWALVLLPRYLA